jgi:hypothetical protein
VEWRSFAVGVVAGEVPGVIGVGEVVCRDRRGVVKFASDFDLALGHWRGEGELTGGEGGAAVCNTPKIQILKISQTCSKFKMNFKFRFKMSVVC